jgi:hypothetical protein
MTAPILAKLAKSRETLQAAIATLTEAQLDSCPGDGWTIREMLTHLVNAEEDHVAVIRAITEGHTDRLPTEIDMNAHNERRVAERQGWTLPQIVRALADQRQNTVALFASLSAEKLALSGRHPVLGERTVDEIFRFIVLHERLHAQEIAAFLKGNHE